MIGESNSDDEWKRAMFGSHALEMATILESRRVTETLGRHLGNLTGAHERLAVLDLCCGTGRLLGSLSSWATMVVGFDYSQELLAIAAEKVRTIPNAVLIQGDVRALSETFAAGQFDVVLRAYTSLGYFSREIEQRIATQCAWVSRPGARFLVDSFNSRWFQRNGSFSRTTVLPGFVFHEAYEWESAARRVSCLWKYEYESGRVVEIPFALDGYDADDVKDLLTASGWQTPVYLDDLATCNVVSDPQSRERVVALATRA